MSRQDANALFARTSFLYGGNAAYIEDLHARYEQNPASVDAEWRDNPSRIDSELLAAGIGPGHPSLAAPVDPE